MVSPLEYISQTRRRDLGQGGGVSYYSPARPVRAPGTLANSGTANRILTGGGGGGYQPSTQQFGGGGPQLGPAPQAAGPTGPQMPAYQPGMSVADMMQAQIDSYKAQVPPQPTGVMGALGTAVNNPIGKAIMAPLNIMDIPRRAVISTIKEGVDAFTGEDASWNDWREQVADPNFGVGTVLEGQIGNKWLDRAIGFAGDVLLDPLTYVVGSGVMAGAGRAARISAASRAVSEGFGKEVTEKLARYGYSSLDNNVRAQLRKAGHVIQDQGWRFKLPGAKVGSKIPLTGPLDQAMGMMGARARAGAYKLPGMSRLAAWRAPEGLEMAFEKLILDRGSMSFGEAAEVVNRHEAHKLAASTVSARLKSAAQKAYMDNQGGDMAEVIRRSETEGGTWVNQFFDEAQKMGQEYGLYFHERANYVPHMVTKNFIEWINGDTPLARGFRSELSIGDKLEEVSPILMERKLLARDDPYKIMGLEFNVPNGTIDEWNSEFARLVPDAQFKMMEDELPAIWSSYIHGFSDDVGVVAGARHLVNSKARLARGYHDEEAMREIVDEVATSRLNDEAATKLRADHKLATAAAQTIKDDTAKGVSGIKGLLGVELRGALEEITSLADDHKLYLGRLLLQEEELQRQVGTRGIGGEGFRTDAGPKPTKAKRAPLPTARRDATGILVADSVRPGMPTRIGEVLSPEGRRVTGVIPVEPPKSALTATDVAPPIGPARPGTIDQAFNDAAEEIGARMTALDNEMAVLSRQMIEDQQVYSTTEAAVRQKRMTDPDNVRKMRNRWDAITAARASAAADQDLLYAIADRLNLLHSKQQRILMVHDNPSMLSVMAGNKVHKKQPQVPGAEYTTEGNRITGYQPIYAPGTRNPDEIRADFQARRDAVLGTSSPSVIDFAADIENLSRRVSRAEAALGETLEIYGPVRQEAKTNLQGVKNEIEDLRAEREALRGPGTQQARQELSARISTIEQTRLVEAQEAYDMIVEPIQRAKATLEFEDKQLRVKQRQQEEAALGEPVPGAAAPRPLPEPEPLPFSPQQVGQWQAQGAKDQRIIREWQQTPEARVVYDLTEQNRRLTLELGPDQSALERSVSGPYSMLTLDGNGNVVPHTRSQDPQILRTLAERDEAAEKLKAVQEKWALELESRTTGEWNDQVAKEYSAINRKAAKEIEPLETEFNRLNTEVVRFGYDKYRGTAMQERLDNTIRLQKKIAATNKKLASNDRQIRKLRGKAHNAQKRLDRVAENMAKQNEVIRRNAEREARPVIPPSVRLRERLASINSDETEALRYARSNLIGHKAVIEDMTVSVPTPVRAVPLGDTFAIHQRFEEITGGTGGRGPTLHPDDDRVLRTSYQFLRDYELYEFSLGPARARQLRDEAREVIKRIEAVRSPGWTRAALDTSNTLDDAVDEIARIQRARMVFPKPADDTLPYLAIHTSHGPVGGSKRLEDRAQVAADAGALAKNKADELLAAGALNKRQVQRLTNQMEELDYYKRLYSGDYGNEENPLIHPHQIDPATSKPRVISPIDPLTGEPMRAAPDPITASRLEQSLHDTMRQAEFMLRYASYVAIGGNPSPEMGAYILAQGLRDEVRVLDSEIKGLDDMIDTGVTKAWQKYEARIAKHQNVVDEQQTIIARINREFEETGFMDTAAKKRAQNKMAEATRLMSDLTEPDTGFMDQEILAMVDFAANRVMDLDDSVSFLRDARHHRTMIDYPARKRAELEQSTTFWAGHLQEMKNSVLRRRKAINKAHREGLDIVDVMPAEFPQKVNLTVDQAEEMLDAGAYNKRTADALRQQIVYARKAGRDEVVLPEWVFDSHQVPLAQAEEELEKVEGAVESLAYTLEAENLKLSVLNGEAHKERNRLANVIETIRTPPDEARIAVLQQRIERLRASGSEGDLKRVESLEEQISLAQNPPTPEELAGYQRQHDRLNKAIEGMNDAVGGDLEHMNAVIDSGQEFLTRLINGDRAPTRGEIKILKDLLGGEAGDVAAQYITNANYILNHYGTNISHEDLIEVFDAIKQAVGDDSLSEYIARNLYGRLAEGELIDSGVYRSELINAMIAAAKTKHSDEMRSFADMFDRMGFQVFTGRTKSEVQAEIDLILKDVGPDGLRPKQQEKLELLQKEIEAPGTPFTRKTMLQAMGYNMSRQTLDMHKMKAFMIQQYQRQGFDPIESLRDRLLTLQLRRNRVRAMIRGLGQPTNEKKFTNAEGFYRMLFGEAEPDVLSPASDIELAVEKSKAIKQIEDEAAAAEEVVPPPEVPAEPATSGLTEEEVTARIDAVIADDSIPMEDKSAMVNELMEFYQSPSPAEAVEPLDLPPPPETVGGRPIAEIEEELAAIDEAMNQGQVSGISEMMTRRDELIDELSSASEAQYLAPEAAAPPPEAPKPKRTRKKKEPEAPPPEAVTPEATEIERLEAFQRGEITMEELEAGPAAVAPPASALPPEMQARQAATAEAAAAKGEMSTAEKMALPEPTAREYLINRRLDELTDLRGRSEFNDVEQAEWDALTDELEGLQRGRVDPITERYGPAGTADEDFLADAASRNLSPRAWEEVVRYQARRQKRPSEVVYDWESVLFDGGPRFDVARRLHKGQGEFEQRARQVGGAAVRPAGPFGRNALPQQLEKASEPLAAIYKAQDELVQMSQRTTSEAERLANETLAVGTRAAESQLATEPRQAYQEGVDWLQAQDIRREGERVQTANEAAINQTLVDRSKARMEMYRAEAEYTQNLLEADMELGHVRSAIVAAHNDDAHLQAAKSQLENALNTTPQSAKGLRDQLGDLREVNKMRKGLTGADEADMVSVEAMIAEGIAATRRLNIAEANEGLLAMRLKNFEDGAPLVANQVERIAVDGWKALASRHLTGEDAIVVTEGLSRALKNAKVSWKDEKFWAQVEKYTAFFKTYATATPGFHVRNAMSGLFMNAVAGVRLRHNAMALSKWREFKVNPQQFWRDADQSTRMAFAMVFGSGAGGQFMERGIGGVPPDIGGRVYQRAMNNKLTQWNKKAGEYVEGPLRLAMALDSVDRGMSLHAGLNRVTNFHFNYNEVSRMDRAAKRMIPFWTFMSRNLPLQIMQMWLHPRTYLHYQSFTRNFSEPGDPLTPEYWLAQGAFTMDENAEKSDNPWFLAPDLPHLRVAEPFIAASKGDWGKALLSDINPAIAAPLEAFGVHEKFYTGAPIEGYSKPEGAMNMFTPIFEMLGATETGGKTGETLTPESWQHMLRTLLPTVGLAERLTSEGGVRAGRQGETVLRALGAPVYKLTPELREAARRSKFFDRKDTYDAQRDLARQ